VSSASFGKREREKKQRERAAAKRQRRHERHDDPETEQPDADAEMERFRVLSEAFASGAIDRATYEAERRAIFSALGVTGAFDDENAS
jgi:hypothetical protein